jgi:hypothetical protein
MGQLGEMRLYNVIHFLLDHHSLQGEIGSYFLLSAGLIGKTKRKRNSNIKISVFLCWSYLHRQTLSIQCRSSVVVTSIRPDDRRSKNPIPGAEGYFSVRHGVQNGHGTLLRLRTFDHTRPLIAEVWERSGLDLQKKTKGRGLFSGVTDKIAASQ